MMLNQKSRGYWETKKWGLLRLDTSQVLPDRWSHASHKKLSFICECNRKTEAVFKNVVSGMTSSCGRCSYCSRTFWLSQKWVKLKLDPDQSLGKEWGPGLGDKLRFNCDCGRKTTTLFCSVTGGKTGSCQKCSFKLNSFWVMQKWGTLKLDVDQRLPDEWGPGAHYKFRFICDCGRYKVLTFNDVNSGKIVSCRGCSSSPREFWESKKWGRLRLTLGQELPNEWGPSSNIKSRFACDCGKETVVVFNDVNNGRTRSCGCLPIGQHADSPESKIREFTLSLTPDTCPSSYRIPGFPQSYDVYVPSQKLAIEHHGLIWHSDKFKNHKDCEKLSIAKSRGDRLIQIYEDEWKEKQEIMKDLIESILLPRKGERIVPIFSVEHSTIPEACHFLDSHHYLGAARGCLTIIARHPKSNEIIGVWVFMKREAGTVLWHRACWDHRYRAWNPHERALKLAVPILKTMRFDRIITFSDNRFHTGEMYKKIGFTFDKNVDPNYYYTNGRTRKSKYAMRVKRGVDESHAAALKGWYRIWDSGKKRYCLFI